MAGLEEFEGLHLDAIFLEDGATESSNAIQTGAVSLDLPASQVDGANASPDATQTSTGAGDVCFEVSTSQEEAPVSLLPRTLKFIRNILTVLQRYRPRQRRSFYDALEIAIMGNDERNSGLTETLISAAQPAEEAPNDTSDVSTSDFNDKEKHQESHSLARNQKPGLPFRHVDGSSPRLVTRAILSFGAVIHEWSLPTTFPLATSSISIPS